MTGPDAISIIGKGWSALYAPTLPPVRYQSLLQLSPRPGWVLTLLWFFVLGTAQAQAGRIFDPEVDGPGASAGPGAAAAPEQSTNQTEKGSVRPQQVRTRGELEVIVDPELTKKSQRIPITEPQGDTTIVLDPELTAPAGEASGTQQAADTMLIADPELAASANQGTAGPEAADPTLRTTTGGLSTGASSLQPLPTELRALVHSRLGRDVVRDNAAEEVWDVQHLVQVEAKLRPNPVTRIALGARFRYGLYATEFGRPDSGQLRYRLELQPLETYYDRSLGPGTHFRLGYQQVQLGRFDAVSGIDVLSIVDLRDGPTVMPDAARLSQLALRLDWALSAHLGLEFYWVPFFTPHQVQVTEGDFAVFPADSNAIDQAWLSGVLLVDRTPAERAALLDRAQATALRSLSRTVRAQTNQAALSAFAPDPDLSASQLALRGVIHGRFGELAWTVATAQEKLPSYRISPAVEAELRAQVGATLDPLPGELQQVTGQATGTTDDLLAVVDELPFLLEYGRFFLGAVDAATDLGAVQLGAELSLTMDRVVPTPGPLYDTLGLAHYERANVLQLGARVEYASAPEWLVVLEGQGTMVLDGPEETGSPGYLGFIRGRYQFSTAAFLVWSPERWRVEVGVAATSEISYVVLPRVAVTLADAYELELGAHVIGGAIGQALGGASWSLGLRYERTDQIYMGFRYAI